MYMVTPYMEHDLSGLLENPAVQFTEPQIKCYLMQLLEGLRYLHAVGVTHSLMKALGLTFPQNRILHRDMKGESLERSMKQSGPSINTFHNSCKPPY